MVTQVFCRTAIAGGVAGAVVLALALAASAEAFAGSGVVHIENQSDRPVKVVLPGSPAVMVPAAGEPAEVNGTTEDGGVGVTVRLWWTDDARQLCQIYVPWGRMVTVTGTGEIRCLAR